MNNAKKGNKTKNEAKKEPEMGNLPPSKHKTNPNQLTISQIYRDYSPSSPNSSSALSGTEPPKLNEYPHLAVKDESTFMITTPANTLKLISKGSVLYESKWFPPARLIKLAYIRRQNFFLILTLSAVYKKDIDGKNIYVWVGFDPSVRIRSYFYSEKLHRLFFMKSYEKLSLCSLNLFRKRIEQTIYRSELVAVKTFTMYGPKDHKFLFISDLKFLCASDLEQRYFLKEEIHQQQTRYDICISVTVDPSQKFAFLNMKKFSLQASQDCVSRIVVYSLGHQRMDFYAQIDLLGSEIGYMKEVLVYSFLGYFGDSEDAFGPRVRLLGLEEDSDDPIHVFEFDGSGKELKKMDLRIEGTRHVSEAYSLVDRAGDLFYYLTSYGAIMKVI